MKSLVGGAVRTASVWFLLGNIALVGVSGCNLLKKKAAEETTEAGPDSEDAAVVATEDVDAAPPPAAGPLASNVDDVARFPDEKPMDNVVATVQRPTNVREIPSVGKVVATLAKGGTVTQLAQRGSTFLVVFENPKDQQQQLMGWVGQESFTALPTVDAGVKPLTCTAPEVPLLSDGPFCGRTCRADTDCPTGQACKGAANKLTNGKLGDAVTVCTVFSPAPPKPSAGTALAVDAGRAATALTPSLPRLAAAKCPAGQIYVAQDKACHISPCDDKSCPKDRPLCIPCSGAKICVAQNAGALCK